MTKKLFVIFFILCSFAMMGISCPSITTGEFTVIFESNGGSPVATVKTMGRLNEPSPPPTKDGYEFDGWYVDSELTTRWDFNEDTLSNRADLTRNVSSSREDTMYFYAKWKPIDTNLYTVSFESNDGSAVSPINGIKSGATISAPAVPTKDGYEFDGWYENPSFSILWLFNEDTVTKNITLYARWKEINPESINISLRTVTFDSNGGSAVAPYKKAAAKKAIAPPPPPTKDGFAFAGWFKDKECTVPWNFAKNLLTENMTLYAKWNATGGYTVTFNSLGGTRFAPLKNVPEGTLISPPPPPSKMGYTFGGWFKDGECTIPWDFTKDTVTENIMLFARWVPSSHTVTFESNGGTIIAPLSGVPHNATITEPTPPTQSGYTFGGWFKDKECTIPWDFAKDTVTENTVLYAKWVPSSYTVTFESNGGTIIAPLNDVPYGNKITEPTPPTKKGFDFGGWFRNKECTSPWRFIEDIVTQNRVLYAKWVPKKHHVAFNSNGGTVIETVSNIPANSTITEPTPPTQSGYKFNGWFKDWDCTIPWNFDEDTVTENTILYAKWSADVSNDETPNDNNPLEHPSDRPPPGSII